MIYRIKGIKPEYLPVVTSLVKDCFTRQGIRQEIGSGDYNVWEGEFCFRIDDGKQKRLDEESLQYLRQNKYPAEEVPDYVFREG